MAIDAFLQFSEPGSAPPLAGETQDQYFKKPKDGGPACFELKNWSFGATNTASIGSATLGAGAGKATFAPFNVTKTVDVATTALFRTLCVGGHYQKLKLWVRKAGGDQNQAGAWYLQWEFMMAFVQDVSWAHNDEGPEETVNFVYGAMRFTYKAQAQTGLLTAGDSVGSWSQVLNAAVA
jgi:type VI secretion system secreted protein Hcp